MVNLIIPLERPEKEDFKQIKYIDHTCHNTPGDSASGNYVIKIPRFDSDTPEQWIIFVDLVHKALVGQNVTTGSSMYKCMERVLKGDAKAEFYLSRKLHCWQLYYSNDHNDRVHFSCTGLSKPETAHV